MTDPEGDVIYYDYDSVKLIRIKRNTDEEAYYAYDAGGRRNYTLLGNGSYTYYDYDVNGRLKRVANHKSDTSVISSFEYTLDPVGNRIAMQINSGDTVYYEYDGIYQLVKEDRRESDDSLVYINYFEYDLAGNRTHLHYVDTSSDDWTYYTYNIENQLTIEETGGVATYYTYDPAGALLSKKTGDDESNYDYNFEGLMDEYASGESAVYFTYDADNRRIWAKRNGTEEKYALSGQDVIADYDESDTLKATYNTPTLDSNVTKKVGENVYFYVRDGLGSVRNLVDASEVIKNTYDYYAFGEVYGTPTENIANRYRFTAREWESIPALQYYRARMLDQFLGRFISKDPVFFPNLYIYVLNNPLINFDPLGLRNCELYSTIRDNWEYFGITVEPLDTGETGSEEAHVKFKYGIFFLTCVYRQMVIDLYKCDADPFCESKTHYEYYTWITSKQIYAVDIETAIATLKTLLENRRVLDQLCRERGKRIVTSADFESGDLKGPLDKEPDTYGEPTPPPPDVPPGGFDF